ncbi:MAG: hypothetical protein WD336_07395 [Trueperaceae bacterium]
MDPLALTLVLTSAGLHAAWNLLAKRVLGGASMTWAYALIGTLALTPAGVWVLRSNVEGLPAWTVPFVLGSAVLHAGYMVSLQRAYAAGDLSVIYPLARGSGPVLATAVAVVALGERPEPMALLGTALVAVSAFALVSGGRVRPGRRAVLLGLATGGFIAAYSVWDATAVARIGVAPILFAWWSEALRAALLTPWAWRGRAQLAREVRARPLSVLGVGVLSPAAYLLVLYAFRLAPVSLVAPAREVSILLTVVAGAGLLHEGQWVRRLSAAAGMAAGVALLALH